ncbi:histidine phosphatase family protein [Paenibacillus sp. Leaf72]|uniref:histidine phosphatase family protein n=1 Tax=Paenibacillus sp. Leaf72 TaxID=1736234 RepID=UPI0006F61FB1|nr:histidine phosphatase family protein [Paenibacillus sp. Leaf72]KQO16618.1 phosphoglycerate kinase [Paenibacillus sp. Leaf72]
MIRIGFIRHGTTEWNLYGRMQGLMDIPLAHIGRDQAVLLGKSLQHADWDGILSSDLDRARQTAELLASSSEIPFLGVDERLRERGFGVLEGTTLSQRIARWGENWRELNLGRESLESVLFRWDSFLEENSRIYDGKRILIVSHGGIIEPVLANRYGTVVQQHLTNTSLSILGFYTSGWRCDLLNCSKHLE